MTVNIQSYRVNATLTEQAHQVLKRNTTPRSIGKFLSELLVQFGNETTVNQRLATLEVRMERFEELIDTQARATDQNWVLADNHTQEMAEGNYITQAQFEKMLQEQGLVA